VGVLSKGARGGEQGKGRACLMRLCAGHGGQARAQQCFCTCRPASYVASFLLTRASECTGVRTAHTHTLIHILVHMCTQRYRFLAEKCWAEMYELRPSLKHISCELQKLQEQLCPDVSACFACMRVCVCVHACACSCPYMCMCARVRVSDWAYVCAPEWASKVVIVGVWIEMWMCMSTG